MTVPSSISARSSASIKADSNADNVLRSRILFLGLRRSGKSSIQQVLFCDMAPKQTFFLETTMRISKHAFNSLIPFEIWDVPGNHSLSHLGVPLTYFDAIVFVIDIQASYHQSIPCLVKTIATAFKEKPDIIFDVFAHKAEVLSEEYKIENFRQIQHRVLDDLADFSLDYDQLPVEFHLTSVYDHSIHAAFSHVLHKLIDSLRYIEDLLNVFCTNSQASKAFLFDTKTRLHVATDMSPVDTATHNLCCDYVEMLNAFGSLYQLSDAETIRPQLPASTMSPLASPKSNANSFSLPPSSPTSSAARPTRSDRTESYASNSTNSTNNTQASSPPPSSKSTHTARNTSSLTAATTASPGPSNGHSPRAQAPGLNASSGSGSGSTSSQSTDDGSTKQLFYPSASTTIASSHPRTLTYHAITPELALLALLPASTFEQRRGLVEYNVVFLREGVREICEVERARRVIR